MSAENEKTDIIEKEYIIDEISSIEREKILQKTAKNLPDNPADSGMRASAVKPKFYGFATDLENSLLASHNASIRKINDCFKNLIEDINNASNYAMEEAKTYTYRKLNQEVIDRNVAIENEANERKTQISGSLLESKNYTDEKISKEVTDLNDELSSLISSTIAEERVARQTSDNNLEKRIENILGTTGEITTIEGAYDKACQYAENLVSRLISNSPEALDTLYELSQALGNDPNFATTITNYINTKYMELIKKSGDSMTGELTLSNGQVARGFKKIRIDNPAPNELKSGFYDGLFAQYSKYLVVGEASDKFAIGYEYNEGLILRYSNNNIWEAKVRLTDANMNLIDVANKFVANVNGNSTNQELYGDNIYGNQTKIKVITVPQPRDLGFDEFQQTEYIKAIFAWICTKYPKYEHYTFITRLQPDSQGIATIFIYNTSEVDSVGMPRYSMMMFHQYGGEIRLYGTKEYKFYYNNILDLIAEKYSSSNLPNRVKDISNNSETSFAYSKTGMSVGSTTWLAAWNNYELRAISKSDLLDYNLLKNKPNIPAVPKLYMHCIRLEGKSNDYPRISAITLNILCDDSGYGGDLQNLSMLLDSFYPDSHLTGNGTILTSEKPYTIEGIYNYTGGDLGIYFDDGRSELVSLYDFHGISDWTINRIL